jgi:hypothetical protein
MSPMATIKIRVCACQTRIQAFFTIAVFELVAEDLRWNIRVKTACSIVGAHRFMFPIHNTEMIFYQNAKEKPHSARPK